MVRLGSLPRVAHDANVVAISQNQQVLEGVGQLRQVLCESSSRRSTLCKEYKHVDDHMDGHGEQPGPTPVGSLSDRAL